MRHYDRRSFRRLQDGERYRDVDYLGDDAWVGPNEAVPYGFTTMNEPPWWSAGPWQRRPFAAERAFDEDRGQGRAYGQDLGLGYGRDYDPHGLRDTERKRGDPYDRRIVEAQAFEWPRPRYGAFPLARPARPDESIYHAVRDLLAEHAGADADDIAVEVVGGEVTLRGVVEDSRLRYLAEDIANDVVGAGAIHNRLRVRPIEDSRAGGSRQWTGRSASSVGGSRH